VIEDLAFFKFLEIQTRHRIDSFLAPAGGISDETGKSNAARESGSTGVPEILSMRAVSCGGLWAGPSSGCLWNQDGARSGWNGH
jgi:hypothetical protein